MTPSRPRAAPRPRAVLCLGAGHWDLIGRPGAPLARGGDAPGKVLRRPGGVALNLARALAARGRPALLGAPVGDDAEGRALSAALAAEGVGLRRLETGLPTGLYLAVEDGAGGLAAAVADLDACEALTPAALAPLLASPEARAAAAWALEGNLPPAALSAAAEASPHGAWLAANPASPAKAARLRAIAPRLDLLVCNRAEAEALTGRAWPGASAAAAALRALGISEVAVTDGAAPAAVVAEAAPLILTPPPLASARPGLATGAGDALFAAYLHARLDAAPPHAALEAGLIAARAALETDRT